MTDYTKWNSFLAADLGYGDVKIALKKEDGTGGSVTFMKPGTKRHDDTIEWSRGYHETCTLNWADDNVKADAEAIDAHMKPIIKYLNDQYVNKRAASVDIGPEYDSAGFTEDDRIVNGQYRNI